MQLLPNSLLRRTAVALAAVAGLSISAHTNAAVVTLSGANGNSCSYSSMSVAPDGSFTVTCTATGGGGTTPNPGTLQLSSQADISVGQWVSITAFRSGGTAGVVGVTVTASGNGCTNGSGPLSWGDTESTAKPINVQGTANGTCTIAISSATGGATLGTPSSVTFNVGTGTATGGGGGTPPPPPVNTANCPTGYTAPTDLSTFNLGGVGNVLLAMARSGQVVSMKLPGVATGLATGTIAFSESAGGAYTPQPVNLVISISKCQGLIDTDQSNRCNLVTSNGNYNSITWVGKPAATATQSRTNAGGYCWAPESEGQWYVNAKWTYSQCAFGVQQCGFAVQQNLGSF